MISFLPCLCLPRLIKIIKCQSRRSWWWFYTCSLTLLINEALQFWRQHQADLRSVLVMVNSGSTWIRWLAAVACIRFLSSFHRASNGLTTGRYGAWRLVRHRHIHVCQQTWYSAGDGTCIVTTQISRHWTTLHYLRISMEWSSELCKAFWCLRQYLKPSRHILVEWGTIDRRLFTEQKCKGIARRNGRCFELAWIELYSA